MSSTCAVATGVLVVVGIVHVIFSIVLGFLIVLVRRETKKRKLNLVHPSSKLVSERRVATVSPPRELQAEQEKTDLSSHSVVLPEDKDKSAVMYYKAEDPAAEVSPMSLREAGNLGTSGGGGGDGGGEVVYRHKAVANLKEEFADPSTKKPSSLILQRTGSAGVSPRKVSSEMVRTSSGSMVRKSSRPSTGTSPFRKSRFSVSSLLNRRSVDLDMEKENLILEGQDQEREDGLQDADDDDNNESDGFKGIILSDDSSDHPAPREAWPSKNDSEC